MTKAFLSHTSTDKEFVLEVARKLGYQKSVVDAFTFEEGIDLKDQIKTQLASSDLFVLFASEKSLSAPWVKYEIDLAQNLMLSEKISNVLVILIDNNITHKDVPSWLQSSLIKNVNSPEIAANLIDSHMDHSDTEFLYIGRSYLHEKFSRDSMATNKDVRNFMFHGLDGIGRRTFAKKIMRENFFMNISTEYDLEPIQPLLSLYRDILSNLKVEDLSTYIKEFQKLNTRNQAKEIVYQLSEYAEHKQIPMLIDKGGMLEYDATFSPDILELLKCIDETDNLYVAYILNRNPKDSDHRDLFFGVYVPELSLDFTEYFLIQQCKRFYDIQLEKSEVKNIGPDLKGYPPTVLFAATEIRDLGIDMLINNPTVLSDFMTRNFDGYIDKYVTEKEQQQVLKLISNFNNKLNLPILNLLVTNVNPIIINLINQNIIKVNHEQKAYEIASPLLDTIGKKYNVLTKNEFTDITRKLRKSFWNTNHMYDSVTLKAIVHSVLRSSQADDIKEFKNVIVPADIFKSAKTAYKNREWTQALTLFKLLKRYDSKNPQVLNYYIRCKIRLEKPVDSDLNALRRVDENTYDSVLSFKLIKDNKYKEAIEVLEKVKKENKKPYIYRELGECYFQTGRYGDVDKIVGEGLVYFDQKSNSQRGGTKYLLDLAAKNAIKIEKFDLALDYINELEKVNDSGSVSHRKATLYFKQNDLRSALAYSLESIKFKNARIEFYLLLTNIYIDLEDYPKANDTFNIIENKFNNTNIKNNPGFIRLKCIYYIRTHNIVDAEKTLEKIEDGKTEFLEIELLKLKLEDKQISIISKKRLEEKIRQLEKSEVVKDLINI